MEARERGAKEKGRGGQTDPASQPARERKREGQEAGPEERRREGKGKTGGEEARGGDRPVQDSCGLRVGGPSHTKCNVSTDSAPWVHPSV